MYFSAFKVLSTTVDKVKKAFLFKEKKTTRDYQAINIPEFVDVIIMFSVAVMWNVFRLPRSVRYPNQFFSCKHTSLRNFDSTVERLLPRLQASRRIIIILTGCFKYRHFLWSFRINSQWGKLHITMQIKKILISDQNWLVDAIDWSKYRIDILKIKWKAAK